MRPRTPSAGALPTRTGTASEAPPPLRPQPPEGPREPKEIPFWARLKDQGQKGPGDYPRPGVKGRREETTAGEGPGATTAAKANQAGRA